MQKFLIHESNLSRLEKKLATVEKKCNKNQFSFHYEITGEQFQTTKDDDGTEYTAKYYEIEVEGEVKHNGWEFVATLDHHADGNIIRAFNTEIAIPTKYRTCGPTCEHCNKIRSRKDTYLVYNKETDEFKQVGKSCLQEFTNGLNAEEVAFYVSIYEKLEDSYEFGGTSHSCYNNVSDMVRYAWECYRHFGYEKSSYDEYTDSYPTFTTRQRVSDYYLYDHGFSFFSSQAKQRVREEMEEVNFNAASEYAKEMTEKSLNWIHNEVKDPDSQYISNLKVICSDEYTEAKNLGMLVSLTTAYMHEIEHREYVAKKEKAASEKAAQDALSEYVGEVGSRLTVALKSFQCLSTWENFYGLTFLYKGVDESDNIIIWYASKSIDDPEKVTSITGTVKDHSEYKSTKQTVMTRCKVVY